jgi:hypothetical protein
MLEFYSSGSLITTPTNLDYAKNVMGQTLLLDMSQCLRTSILTVFAPGIDA